MPSLLRIQSINQSGFTKPSSSSSHPLTHPPHPRSLLLSPFTICYCTTDKSVLTGVVCSLCVAGDSGTVISLRPLALALFVVQPLSSLNAHLSPLIGFYLLQSTVQPPLNSTSFVLERLLESVLKSRITTSSTLPPFCEPLSNQRTDLVSKKIRPAWLYPSALLLATDTARLDLAPTDMVFQFLSRARRSYIIHSLSSACAKLVQATFTPP